MYIDLSCCRMLWRKHHCSILAVSLNYFAESFVMHIQVSLSGKIVEGGMCVMSGYQRNKNYISTRKNV